MSKKKDTSEAKAYLLSKKIEKEFRKFKDNIEVIDWNSLGSRICYELKLKGGTRKEKIFAHAQEVQSRLKLPIFYVYQSGFSIYIVASEKETKYPHLLKILNNPDYEETLEEMELPYVIGYNNLGNPVITDISTFPHLLLGGSTNSGKSVGLRVMITTSIYGKPPSKVNLVLIDVGSGDLIEFDGIPHLSCPVVRDHETAYRTIASVKTEMERRIKLEQTNLTEFKRLPRLVMVIDEFPALFMGLDNKKMLQQMKNDISSLLQRGRHAKIHLILAAQNPTVQNMKVDLGNITARIVFRCAKKNYSETILGESGAESLFGPGNLLLKSPLDSGLQRIQGIYIKPKEIQETVRWLQSSQYRYQCGETDNKFNLVISPNSQEEIEMEPYPHLRTVRAVMTGPSEQESQLAAVIFWAFGKNHISTNLLMVEHHLGWNKAANLVRQLEQLGIVGQPNGKQPRVVRPNRIDDISDELVEFMEYCDYPRDSLICAFQGRVIASTERKSEKTT